MADRVAHLDCTAGVAGDMLLGALLGAGASLDAVRATVRSLGLGLDVTVERVRRAGFAATRAVVHAPPEDPPVHRRLADVLGLLSRADLGPAAERLAVAAFELLADAEAAVHGTGREEVHFHEVGALDALADVTGCAAALADLGLARAGAVTVSPLAAGSGTVRSAHGPLPVPAPAVLEIARRAGLVLAGGELPGERTTPTGAALVAVAAAPGPAAPMAVRAVGSGAGARDTPERPNLTRAVVGAAPATTATEEPVLVVESTVDDLDPRLWPSVLSALRAAGAWDCWTTGTVGRHGRPGRVVTAVCPPHLRAAVADALFAHTGTLGVRWTGWQRAVLPRRTTTVTVGGHEVGVKLADGPAGARTATPELADVERAAAALGRPARAVVDDAVAAARAAEPGHPVG